MDTRGPSSAQGKVKLGYEFTYIHAALAPVRGHLIALLLPDRTGDSFQLLLEFFETQVKKLYRRRKVLLILDQASAHHYKTAKNCQVVLHYLPVASPELNCVERFFEEIRKPLSNPVFKNIAEVEKFLCRTLKK